MGRATLCVDEVCGSSRFRLLSAESFINCQSGAVSNADSGVPVFMSGLLPSAFMTQSLLISAPGRDPEDQTICAPSAKRPAPHLQTSH